VAIAVTLIPDLEKDTQFSQGLQIDADQEEAWVMADFKSGSRFRYISTSLCLVFILTTVKTYYLEFHRKKYLYLVMAAIKDGFVCLFV
jgi:hypothetical protein